jgi:hypothetical protein
LKLNFIGSSNNPVSTYIAALLLQLTAMVLIQKIVPRIRKISKNMDTLPAHPIPSGKQCG